VKFIISANTVATPLLPCGNCYPLEIVLPCLSGDLLKTLGAMAIDGAEAIDRVMKAKEAGELGMKI
jgi:hypothetical protein